MLCTNCGAKLDDDIKFCASCGAKVKPKKTEEVSPENEEKQKALIEELGSQQALISELGTQTALVSEEITSPSEEPQMIVADVQEEKKEEIESLTIEDNSFEVATYDFSQDYKSDEILEIPNYNIEPVVEETYYAEQENYDLYPSEYTESQQTQYQEEYLEVYDQQPIEVKPKETKIKEEQEKFIQKSGSEKTTPYEIPDPPMTKYWLIPIVTLVYEAVIYLLASKGKIKYISSIKNSPIEAIITNYMNYILIGIFAISIVVTIALYAIANSSSTKIRRIQRLTSKVFTNKEKLVMEYTGYNYEIISREGFSIPAFLLSWIYLLYRKAYASAITGMIGAIVLKAILPDNFSNYVGIVIALLLGVVFNKMYIDSVELKVQNIIEKNPGKSLPELAKICHKKGGTSFIPLAVYVVYLVVLAII